MSEINWARPFLGPLLKYGNYGGLNFMGSFFGGSNASLPPRNGGTRFPKRCARTAISRFTTSSPKTPTPNTSPMSSEQNLVPDQSKDPLRHPQIGEVFVKTRDGKLKARGIAMH
jgi:hypothetical protein